MIYSTDECCGVYKLSRLSYSSLNIVSPFSYAHIVCKKRTPHTTPNFGGIRVTLGNNRMCALIDIMSSVMEGPGADLFTQRENWV